MPQITQNREMITFINIFTVAPENQQALVDILVEATHEVMNRQPGFISVTIHKSLDGTRVVNYAQWRSRTDFETALSKPEARAHIGEARKLATGDPHIYTVDFIDEALKGNTDKFSIETAQQATT